MNETAAIWSDAVLAAMLTAVDPAGLGGVHVRASAGQVRDRWRDVFRTCLPPGTLLRKMPPGISDGRLLGGVDLAATLQSGRPVVERGLLAEVHGGVLLAVMAERLEGSTIAHLNAALDAHEVHLERDGLSLRLPSSFAVIAFDEGIDDDEQAPASLRDRLAFSVDLSRVPRADLVPVIDRAMDVAAARRSLRQVTITTDLVEALCATALSLGISSLRAPLLAVAAARAAAALGCRTAVGREDAEIAARLVLAPRATMLPAAAEPPQSEEQKPDDNGQSEQDPREPAPLDDMLLEAARAAIPPDLLEKIRDQTSSRQRSSSAGKEGLARSDPRRGRSIGVRRGELRGGARLNVLATLRAAAPWQPLRRRSRGVTAGAGAPARLLIEKDDFRITRYRQHSATVTIFVVDASGSAALQRLAEVKGAVELLLADCYVRRDEVALIAFRGNSAEVVLPPTRSLARAKRSLAALPGGGGTPLSKAIDAATKLALAVRSKGQSPTIVLMTDGSANVSRDGKGGRAAAEAEAHEAARHLRVTGIPAVLVDTSARPRVGAEKLAMAMQARYLALPYADAARLSRAVQAQVSNG